MSGATDRRAIVVAGTHRSGTSALTRVINLLGAALPRTLAPPGPGNDGGHWESSPIDALHAEMLQAVGSSWADPTAAPHAEAWAERLEQFQPRLATLIEAEFDDASLFVVKDPRICRLLPVWFSTLGDLGISPVCVVPVRHPLEVARSLAARNRLAVDHGVAIWVHDSLEIERATRDVPRAFCRYDDLLRDWRSVADAVGARLGIEWRSSEEVRAEIDRYLDPAARHHTAGAEAGDLGEDGFGAWARAVHAGLERLCDSPHAAVGDDLDRVSAELATADRLHAPILRALAALRDRDEAERNELRALQRRTREQLGHATARLADAEGRLLEAQEQLADLRHVLGSPLSAPLRWIGIARRRRRGGGKPSEADRRFVQGLLRAHDDALGEWLRGHEDVVMVNYPNHHNVGDPALWLGARASLRRLGVRVAEQLDSRTYDARLVGRALERGATAIVICGGGNLGDQYPAQLAREATLRDFPDVPTLQLPQSVWFERPTAATRFTELCESHRDLTVLVRERASLELAERILPVQVRLCPDSAWALGPLRRPVAASAPVSHLRRTDREATDRAGALRDTSAGESWDWIQASPTEATPLAGGPALVRVNRALTAASRRRPLSPWTHRFLTLTYGPLARQRLAYGVHRLCLGRVVITDRLHGHILASLLGIPHVVVAARTTKLRSSIETWAPDGNGVRWAEDHAQAREIAAGLASGA